MKKNKIFLFIILSLAVLISTTTNVFSATTTDDGHYGQTIYVRNRAVGE